MGLPLKNFVKIKASLPKNSIFFYSTPKGVVNFYNNLPLENSMVPQPGGGGGVDIKCNSPMQIINKEMRTAITDLLEKWFVLFIEDWKLNAIIENNVFW